MSKNNNRILFNVNENIINKIFQLDCIELLTTIQDNSIDLTLTDIPYKHVNKSSNGLRVLDKKEANEINFDIDKFLYEIDRVTKGSGYIFCGKEQVSGLFDFFNQKGYTTRLMIWEKTNPSPMNCQHTWMSGIETFVYFKKKGATFNEHYKNCIVRFPNGSSKIHPTQKPIKLFEYLIKTSTNESDVVCDPCVGSGTTLSACQNLNRNYIVGDINKKYVDMIKKNAGLYAF